MDKKWQKIAQRIVQGLRVQPGELIDVRDHTGSIDVVMETILAVERAGATPLLQLHSGDYLERLWSEASLDHLTHWDKHRQEWMKQIDRVLVLSGAPPDFSLAPKEALDAWEQAQYRLSLIEEERRLPYLVAAIPTEKRAKLLGITLQKFRRNTAACFGGQC